MSDWPNYFKENLIIGNLNSGVGVATLWSPREAIAKGLDPKTYCVVGQLYSNDGINPMIRNVMARPQIRTIVLCGQDKIGSADSLALLIKNGIDEKGKVIGKPESKVEKEIPPDAVEQFRQSVKLIDLRGVFDTAKIQEAINAASQDNTPFAEPKLFPEPEISTDRYPTDASTVKIRGKYVGEVWLRLLFHIMRFGAEKQAHHGTKQKELWNIVTVIEEEDPTDIKWAPWFNFTREHFEGYLPQVMTKEKIPSLEYTYGQRLRDHAGVDQVKSMIEKLKKEPFSRRAVAMTWNVQSDDASTHPPCLDVVQCIVQDETLLMNCYFRSNDMFRAWPENALALRTMHKEIADATGIMMGSLSIISASAHVYEESYAAIKEMLKEYYPKALDFCEFDPRGNFVISVSNGNINLIHMNPTGTKIGTYSGKTAMQVYQKLVEDHALSVIGHALDLGGELQKAEMCLRLGIPYTQDRPVPFGEAKKV